MEGKGKENKGKEREGKERKDPLNAAGVLSVERVDGTGITLTPAIRRPSVVWKRYIRRSF